jgi:hypothetical protein
MSIKKQKGFIRIPLLLIIIASIAVVSLGVGYILHKIGKLAPLEAGISNFFRNSKIENSKIEEPATEAIQQNQQLAPLPSAEDVVIESPQAEEQTPKPAAPSPSIKIPLPQSTIQPKTNIETPTSPPSTPAPSKVVEPNYSDVVVKLYSAQLEVLQNIIDNNAEAKNIYTSIKQVWSDELIKTQVYLSEYPNDPGLTRDAQYYTLLMQLSDVGVQILNEAETPAFGVKTLIQNEINSYKTRSVSLNEMPAIFADLDKTEEFNGLLSNKLKGLYTKYANDNHDAAVKIDAIHNVELAKNQQEIDQTTALIAETDRIIAYSHASLKQAQDEINTIRASQPVYCTATRTMPGSVSIVCQ